MSGTETDREIFEGGDGDEWESKLCNIKRMMQRA